MQVVVYEVTAAAKLMNVDTETLKNSAFAVNGYVAAISVEFWNNGNLTPFCKEKLLLPKRRFMEYFSPFLVDMPESAQNTMLDAFKIMLDELKTAENE